MEGFDVTSQQKHIIENNLEKMIGTSYGQMHEFLGNLRKSDYGEYSLQVSFLYDVVTGDIPWLGRSGDEQALFSIMSSIDFGKFTLSWNDERYRIVDVELGERTESSELVIVKSIVEYNKTYGF
ncbi:hypothetical protein HOD05_02905 [Candidatus Woesearchaeota archaeon]|nr:hypothetical protein [Candidatus Woesearchaeota archaeon]MBT4151322.1 hypothetical protein [Candidatus Woesearchaeota archaeon]MBT4247441.1 hypothetical protein [Candidatus Woesearchaeota archaeon]MBT4434144.1 hypothetical protein [Candidatus Woesearchaeota archaeon]MBT5215920.1 hypothetical protein [Candidatus Woesearchaeota archaeon]